ncbi:MAG: FRG domain-containing protein [Methylobacter sp.]
MPDFDYPEHYTDSIWSALELAMKLKEAGEYDLFRGQRHTFAIQPSALRQGVEDADDAQRQLNEFATWVHSTPDLSSLHGNGPAILAVAQHYGMKTPLLDFSRSPRIAAFFATDGGIDGDTGTIICLNRKRFVESWSDLNSRYHKDKGNFLAEIIDIDVKNLWRLQAQEGAFLKCYVDPNLLEMFSCFLHIYFPQKSETIVESTEKIYPAEKSHLEVLLDQYFLIASYPERERQMNELFGHRVSISEEAVKREISTYFKENKIPREYDSWRGVMPNLWMQEPEEDYHDQDPAESVTLQLPTLSKTHDFEISIEKQLIQIFENNKKHKGRARFHWNVNDEDGNKLYVDQEGITKNKDGEFTEFAIADMINAIYSGMRYLPYKQQQIVRAIVRYLLMLRFGVYKVIQDCVKWTPISGQ